MGTSRFPVKVYVDLQSGGINYIKKSTQQQRNTAFLDQFIVDSRCAWRFYWQPPWLVRPWNMCCNSIHTVNKHSKNVRSDRKMNGKTEDVVRSVLGSVVIIVVRAERVICHGSVELKEAESLGSTAKWVSSHDVMCQFYQFCDRCNICCTEKEIFSVCSKKQM